jgi:hypothetical protein
VHVGAWAKRNLARANRLVRPLYPSTKSLLWRGCNGFCIVAPAAASPGLLLELAGGPKRRPHGRSSSRTTSPLVRARRSKGAPAAIRASWLRSIAGSGTQTKTFSYRRSSATGREKLAGGCNFRAPAGLLVFLVDSRTRFEALYRAHYGTVRSFVHRRVPSAAADDVVADVFVIAWRPLDKAPGNELPWLLGIARGLLANRRRGEARQLALPDRLAASTVAGVQQEPEASGGGRADACAWVLGQARSRGAAVGHLGWAGSNPGSKSAGRYPGSVLCASPRARRQLERALAAQGGAVEQRVSDPPGMEVSLDER